MDFDLGNFMEWFNSFFESVFLDIPSGTIIGFVFWLIAFVIVFGAFSSIIHNVLKIIIDILEFKIKIKKTRK